MQGCHEARLSDIRHSFSALTTFACWLSVSCGYIGKETISARHSFGHRKVTLAVAKSAISLLQMQRNGIMNARADTGSLETVLHLLPVRHAHDIKMIDRSRPRWLEWEN